MAVPHSTAVFTAGILGDVAADGAGPGAGGVGGENESPGLGMGHGRVGDNTGFQVEHGGRVIGLIRAPACHPFRSRGMRLSRSVLTTTQPLSRGTLPPVSPVPRRLWV